MRVKQVIYRQTLHTTCKTDLAISRIRELLQALAEVTKSPMHLGTVIPIYTACLRVVLNVLGYVAFTSLVQNYLSTNLSIIYTVVQISFIYHILLLAYCNLNLMPYLILKLVVVLALLSLPEDGYSSTPSIVQYWMCHK
jgi:hypothetical protein